MATEKLRYHIDGMTCQGCAKRLEKTLSREASIASVAVNFASEEAQIRYDDTRTTPAQIQRWIEKTGYRATQILAGVFFDDTAGQDRPWRSGLLIALGAPFMIDMLSGRHWGLPLWLQFALASTVQLWLALPFYRGALASLRGRSANMDVLVSLGTGTIYLYSALVYLSGNGGHLPLYFEAGVMVITFVGVGKALETRSKRRILNSLGALLRMTPDHVQIRRDGKWRSLPLGDVRGGDFLRARYGDRIAADGILEEGNLFCDESHLTGESTVVEKRIGDSVLAGAQVTQGSGVYVAETLGEKTFLGDMMRALSEAQSSKAPIARVADKVAAVFVPVVIVLASVTFALNWWLSGDLIQAMVNAVAVLVVTCPCALGLATPAAIMAGMGQAVSHGIWFRDAAALEAAAGIDTVIFDKTGTLTRGRPELIAIHGGADNRFSEDTLLQVAASIEQHANHPFARALVAAAEERDLPLLAVDDPRTTIGAGIVGEISGIGSVRVGKPEGSGRAIAQTLHEVSEMASIVTLDIDRKPVAAFVIADALRSGSERAVARLHDHGIEVKIMSGDDQRVVDAIAATLGIDDACGGMSPRGKLEALLALQEKGRKVAMVGDGVNDAPALAAATVSFAMKGGTDVAENVAAATLMHHSANQLADALAIARATMATIRENLFFAFFYNFLCIPLAAFGIITPMIAGAAMALSSLSVLANALRLKWLRLRR